MKPRKLTPRFVIVLIVLLATVYYLLPTFQYESLRRTEEREAAILAEKMDVTYSYVLENLYKDQSILADRLFENTKLSDDEKDELHKRLEYLQGKLQDKALKYKKSAIKRGLDLQGGMHLVLEVDLVQLLQNLARTKDAQLEGLLAKVDEHLNNDPTVAFTTIIKDVFEAENVSLSQYYGEAGETNAVILADLDKQSEDAINRSREILGNRIDQFGVSEPTIQKQGNRRIILELPGVQDPARARDLIGRTALLEFNLIEETEKTQATLNLIDLYLSKKAGTSPATDDFETGASDVAEDENAIEETTPAVADTEVAKAEDNAAEDEDAFDISAEIGEGTAAGDTTGEIADALDLTETPFTSLLRGVRGEMAVPAENLRQVRSILADPRLDKTLPHDAKFVWSAKPEVINDEEYYLLYYVKSEPELTGSGLTDAQVDISQGYNNPGTAGQPIISFELNRTGARKFARVTGANIGKRLAIVMDDKVFMAPSIRSKIPDGRGIIEGSDSVEEANDIAIVLRAGALPTTVVIEEERTVGPSLGRDSIRKGTISAIIGLILVIIFMAIYYGMCGLIADVALLLNILLIFGGLAFFGKMGMGATLSLPGIAGIILTIGMAVDANVLIFERIREELATGKTVWHAISAGYDRAFTTILDANVTTLIAALVLLQFGSGPVKGFAVTLSIGIVASLFTAIVVTRLIFDFINSRKTIKKLSI